MYSYTLIINRLYIDYYTGDETYSPENIYTFSDNSFWAARFRLMLDLAERQRKNTIVDFDVIKIQLSTKGAELINLGNWELRPNANYSWNWQAEAHFLEKHNLYRAWDSELLAIEQIIYQNLRTKKDADIIIDLRDKLTALTEKYTPIPTEYAPEIGLLYYHLDDQINAFAYLMRFPMLRLRDLTYRIASSFLLYDKALYREYMQAYDAAYAGYRPPFLS